jgi:hypothetical protein
MSALLLSVYIFIFSWQVSVCVATAYGLDDRVLISGRGKRIFCTVQRLNRLWARLASYPVGTEGSFPEAKAASV